MTELLNALIEALRNELRQYGEMLARLDEQQDSIMRRVADDILATVGSVREQGEILQGVRRERESRQRQLARHLRQSESVGLLDLIDKMPPDYRPLARALMDENNELLARVQQRARQNHLLLRRSLDLMQQLLHSLIPSGHSSVYDQQGQTSGPEPAALFCNAAA